MLIALLGALAVFTGLWSLYFYRSFIRKKQGLRTAIRTLFAVGTNRPGWLVHLGVRFDQSEYGKRVAAELEKMHLLLRPSEYFMFLVLGNVVIIWVLSSFLAIPILPGMFLAGFLVDGTRRFLFRIRKNRNIELFHKQLPEACRLLGNSLQAGLTVSQGIELLAKDMPSPANQEFQMIHKELMLGVELDKALESFQCRMKTRECDLFTGAISIQRKVGGNLFAVLEDMARTMEERAVMNQTIRTMTAEAKYISFVLPLVPIVLIAIMNMMIEGFLKPLLSMPGIFLIIFFLVVQMVALAVIKKIISFKV